PYSFTTTPTPPTPTSPLSLHDALPISGRTRGCATRLRPTLWAEARRPRNGRWRDTFACCRQCPRWLHPRAPRDEGGPHRRAARGDRKSTRLNSSHVAISYAVFCLKKKK